MGYTVRAELVAGRETDHMPGHKHGSHALCASEDCPCVCNDSDFRWSRKPSSETQREMAHVIAVRPELAELFR